MNMIVRDACHQDLSSLVDLYNRYILETSITFDLSPYTVEQRRQSWFDHYNKTGRYRLMVAECDGQIVGYASSSQFAAKAAYETSVETSIYVALGRGNEGIGSQLYTALFQALAAEDIHRAYAGITLPNDASIAIHQKFGFKQSGIFREVGRKFDQYWDVAWYEKEFSV
ncbi:MAG: N-acetyltransferase family protein [Cyanobacteria bacterium J06621_11]